MKLYHLLYKLSEANSPSSRISLAHLFQLLWEQQLVSREWDPDPKVYHYYVYYPDGRKRYIGTYPPSF